MMRGTTKKVAAILCAALVISILAGFIVMCLAPLFDAGTGAGVAIGILVLYAGFILAVIVGVLLALRQRLREIERGEEEDAKKY